MEMNHQVVLDPTGEREPAGRPLAPPLATASPARITLLDIHKPRGSVFLDELAQLLGERGYDVARASKPTFTKPAPADLRREIAEQSAAVVEALAD